MRTTLSMRAHVFLPATLNGHTLLIRLQCLLRVRTFVPTGCTSTLGSSLCTFGCPTLACLIPKTTVLTTVRTVFCRLLGSTTVPIVVAGQPKQTRIGFAAVHFSSRWFVVVTRITRVMIAGGCFAAMMMPHVATIWIGVSTGAMRLNHVVGALRTPAVRHTAVIFLFVVVAARSVRRRIVRARAVTTVTAVFVARHSMTFGVV